MKSWVKGMLIASAICICTGTAISVGAWAVGGRFSYFRNRAFGFSERDSGSGEEEVYEGDGIEDGETGEQMVFRTPLTSDGKEIRKLEVVAVSSMVRLAADESVEEIVVMKNNDSSHCQFHQEVDGDKLEIHISLENVLWEEYSLDFLKQEAVTILIPAGTEFQKMELELKAGILKADQVTSETLELDLDAGQLTVTEGNVQKLKGECRAGELLYQGQVTQKMEADCLAGKIQYDILGQSEDFRYDLEAMGGTVVINGEEQGKGFYETTINPEADKKAELECKAGTVYVDFH